MYNKLMMTMAVGAAAADDDDAGRLQRAMTHRFNRAQNSITATWRAPRPATDDEIVFT